MINPFIVTNRQDIGMVKKYQIIFSVLEHQFRIGHIKGTYLKFIHHPYTYVVIMSDTLMRDLVPNNSFTWFCPNNHLTINTKTNVRVINNSLWFLLPRQICRELIEGHHRFGQRRALPQSGPRQILRQLLHAGHSDDGELWPVWQRIFCCHLKATNKRLGQGFLKWATSPLGADLGDEERK